MQILIGLLVILIMCFAFLLIKNYNINEGYENIINATINDDSNINDAEYTQNYTKQIENYLKAENEIKTDIEKLLVKEAISWQINVDKIFLAKQIEELPKPMSYMDALKKQNAIIDAQLIENDVDIELIYKINSFTSLEELKVLSEKQKEVEIKKLKLKDAIHAITLLSLSKFKERAIELQKYIDEIYILVFRIAMKTRMQPNDPITANEFIKYEIDKFSKPIWGPLQFVLGRLAKVMSIGMDGKAKYNENEGMGLAIKELSDKSKVTDIDKFYLLMSTNKGEPSANIETLEKLFNNPINYLNLILYMGGKMKEMTGKTWSAGEGFLSINVMEGWEDIKKIGKCIPCQIEPEVQDIDGLKKRYVILKNSRKQFKAEIEKLMENQAKAEEIEKKAMSGELMSEMIANRKIE
jgi:hypothetical protein